MKEVAQSELEILKFELNLKKRLYSSYIFFILCICFPRPSINTNVFIIHARAFPCHALNTRVNSFVCVFSTWNRAMRHLLIAALGYISLSVSPSVYLASLLHTSVCLAAISFRFQFTLTSQAVRLMHKRRFAPSNVWLIKRRPSKVAPK